MHLPSRPSRITTWESILEAVREILREDSRRKWSKSLSSRASSNFNMEEAEAEEDYILILDEEQF